MPDIIECPNCGQKNRLNDDKVKEAKCGKCWKIIYTNPNKLEKEKIISNPKSYGWVFGLIGIIVFVIFINSHDSSPNKRILKSEPTFYQPEQPIPYSGEIKNFTYDDRVAPLKINTSYGLDYVVKLKDTYTKKPIMTIFIRGGGNIETKVPLGTYEITYASGSKWYGYDYLFGPETGYSKADEVFSFKNTGYQINGYTITLQRVFNGNLKELRISKSDF